MTHLARAEAIIEAIAKLHKLINIHQLKNKICALAIVRQTFRLCVAFT